MYRCIDVVILILLYVCSFHYDVSFRCILLFYFPLSVIGTLYSLDVCCRLIHVVVVELAIACPPWWEAPLVTRLVPLVALVTLVNLDVDGVVVC